MNRLHSLIQSATNAPARDLATIANIMREEVFHSMLDWQTRDQLVAAAQTAFARLNESRELYEASRAHRLELFQQMRSASAPN